MKKWNKSYETVKLDPKFLYKYQEQVYNMFGSFVFQKHKDW